MRGLPFSIASLAPVPVQRGEIPPGMLTVCRPRYTGQYGIPEATFVDNHDLDYLHDSL